MQYPCIYIYAIHPDSCSSSPTRLPRLASSLLPRSPLNTSEFEGRQTIIRPAHFTSLTTFHEIDTPHTITSMSDLRNWVSDNIIKVRISPNSVYRLSIPSRCCPFTPTVIPHISPRLEADPSHSSPAPQTPPSSTSSSPPPPPLARQIRSTKNSRGS